VNQKPPIVNVTDIEVTIALFLDPTALRYSPILIENMFSTHSPLELNHHRILLSSDVDTNELIASLGIALPYMSSRIDSSLCSSPPLSIDAISSALFGWPSQNRKIRKNRKKIIYILSVRLHYYSLERRS